MQLQHFMMAAALLSLGASPTAAQTVPTEFQALHDQLYGGLATFRDTMAQSWDGTRAPVAFGAEILGAHSARGPALLDPSVADSVLREVDNLKALGVKAVTLHIDFPMLHRPFHRTEQEYQQYLAFYSQLARDVRARDLKLVVVSQALFSRGAFTPWPVGAYYDSLTLQQYEAGRMNVARTIAAALRPDYLSVIVEPDTEADQVGKPAVGTVTGSRALLDEILNGIQAAGVTGVAVGAGIGTWQEDYRAFVESFAATSVDYIDVHLYPLTRDYYPRVFEIADLAAAYGKQVGMSETWLYKINESEHDLHLPAVFARDSFSFWAPLDALHLQTMVDLAHFKRFAFMTPFWSGFFRGYVDYDDTTRGMTFLELDRLAEARQSANLLAGVYSLPGHVYRTAIVDPADVTAPSAPRDVLAQLATATGAAVTWTAATDDVGTAAYAVMRDGAYLGQTALTHYFDSDLDEARSYVYSVVALDAAGNMSEAVSAAMKTPDRTAPSIPQGVSAVATLTGSQIGITLSWTPANDNVGVTQYLVTRGSSPDALSPIAGPAVNSYAWSNVRPDTTYYFGVASIDAARNISAQSVVTVTTPPLPDITAPIVRMVYPADGATPYRSLYLYAVTYDVPGGTYDVPSGAAAVRFFIDGNPVGPEQAAVHVQTAQYSVFKIEVAMPGLGVGEHQVTAVSRDRAGNVATSAPLRVVFRP